MRKVIVSLIVACMMFSLPCIGVFASSSQCEPDEHSFMQVEGTAYKCEFCGLDATLVAESSTLESKVETAADGSVFLLKQGSTYTTPQIHVEGKSVTIIGLGKDDEICTITRTSKQDIFMVSSNKIDAEMDMPEYSELTLVNVKIDGANQNRQAINVKYNSTVNLYSVEMITGGSGRNILIDNGNTFAAPYTNELKYYDGLTSTVNAYGSSFDTPIWLNGHPLEKTTYTTYSNFNYDDKCTFNFEGKVAEAQGVAKGGDNIKINGVAINPAVASLTYKAPDTTEHVTTRYANLNDVLNIVNNTGSAGDYTITLLKDYSEDMIISQREGVNVTVTAENMDDIEYTGTIFVSGSSRSVGKEKLTFKDIKFDGSAKTDYYYCIDMNWSDESRRYPHNVKVIGCEFVDDDHWLTGVRGRQTHGTFEVSDCVQNGGYQLLWSTGGVSGVVTNVTVSGVVEGINTNTTPFTISNAAISASNLGIRFNSSSGSLDFSKNSYVNNCTISAPTPIVIRKNGPGNIGISNSTFNSADGGTKIIDDQTVQTPVIELTSNSFSYSDAVAIIEGKTPNGYQNFISLEDAVNAATNGDIIILQKDVAVDPTVEAPFVNAAGKTIDLNGNVLTGNILGTLRINGGKFVTPEGYNQIVPKSNTYGEKDVFVSDDVVVTLAGGMEGMSLTMNSGTVSLGTALPDGGWYTLDGQNLVVASGAAFEIPEDMFFYVKAGTNVTIQEGGQLVLNEGSSIKLELGATLKAEEGLNVVGANENVDVIYKNGTYNSVDVTGKEAKIGNNYYNTLEEAVAADGTAIIVLLKNVELESLLIANGETIDLNGKTLTGDVLGILKVNGGKFVTPQGYNQIVPKSESYGEKDIFVSDDAMVTLAGGMEGMSLTMNSGTVSLGTALPDGGWYTLDGQKLIVADGATFDIPAGMWFYIKNGTSAEVNGNITMGAGSSIKLEPEASLKAMADLNVVPVEDNTVVVYKNGVYSVEPIYNVSFDVIPAEAEIIVKDSENNIVQAEADGSYKLINGNYSYSVSKSGYITKTDSFVVNDSDVTCSVTLSIYVPKPNASSKANYNVIVADSVNGDVSVTTAKTTAGTNVTINVDPDSGYILKNLMVIDKNGNEVELSKVTDTQYRFKMPSSEVTVSADFIEEKDVLNSFSDVFTTDYYYDPVLWAVKNGITSGTSATTFSPNAVCTRAQAVTFLWKVAGSPKPLNSVNNFTDVTMDDYYFNAVQWAFENGITSGTGDGSTFSPDAECTRSQIVTFLWRSQGSEQVIVNNPFVDVSGGAYYEDAVLWAVEESITSGTGAETFSPNTNCTRGQIVTFLYNCVVK